jgi:galactose mutarotase-like enzyme
MVQTISNSILQLTVTEKGTEISSIKSLQSNKEYMWNADPLIWGSHAPVLFPAIGAFKNNECTIEGMQYKIPKHGFIRHNDNIILSKRTKNELNFRLDYSEETLKIYPYKFRFYISFKLEGKKILISHRVENLNDSEIYFSLGAHPAFKCPINKGENYEDYYLEFEQIENAERTLLSDTGLISDKTEITLNKSKILNLNTDLFNDDALIFKQLKSRKVSLKSRKSTQVLSLEFNDFSYLGIWAKPNAPFVCIEPWLGIADHENTNGDFLTKEGIITLPKGDEFTAQYSIEIEE